MAHQHAHGHADGAGRKLRTAFSLTLVILAVEVAGGILGNSLALFSDAGHVLTDVFALGMAWFAAIQAQRPPTERHTFGYHRVGILAALGNALLLFVVAGLIVYEAVGRLRHPEAVQGLYMFLAAGVGILVNGYIGMGLRTEQQNLNVRSALMHVLGDAAAAGGVVVAGLIITYTAWYPADPLVSVLIAVLIAFSAWNIVRETVAILLESTPPGVNTSELIRAVLRVPGVQDIHDLHIWGITPQMPALACHLLLDDQTLSESERIVGQVRQVLEHDFGIEHTTLQLECRGCGVDSVFCAWRAGSGAHNG